MTSRQPYELRLRQQVLGAGFSDTELSRLVRSGQWARLRRGVYLPGTPPPELVARTLLRIHAAMTALRRPAVVSHQSAAVLLGLPLWNVPLGRVHVTRPPGASTDSRRVLRCHVARLRDDEIVEVDGLAVTSPVRTVLDLARSLPFEAGVVVADAALHKKAVSAEALRQRLFDLTGLPGCRAAARVVSFADDRSESVGESRSRVILHKVGVAAPTLQLPIRSSAGGFLGRVDFAWEHERVVGEFDGRIKYGRLLRPGQEPGDALFEEKLREDAIRAEDWGVVRWVWDDLAVPGRLRQRILQALERGARRR